ncbi:MAG: polyprenyl synthetase family protein [Methanomassiliicoccaceae archaeon]|jgi:octaprenyl-diphosphate synthase|nr:polyprenyl synthetase family protein [Methanomassiliicoccaceae archaeon]
MEKQWYVPISEDLEKVDRNIADVLRSDRPELQEMCDYITSSGGKKIRPAMCILSHYACGGNSREEIRRLASAFEMIHIATLVHDDINDRSEIRRGRRTVHEKYTVTKAVILGDFIFAMGFKLFSSTDRRIVDAVVDASTAMAESEFIQKEFEHRPVVTENDYMRIIRGKTAMPIYACARTGAYLAGADDETSDAVSKFALEVGLAFQVVDDVLDIIGDHRTTGKKIGIDIKEGKPTLPIIYAMADPEKGSKIKELFGKTDMTDDDMQKALDLIKGTDAVDRCFTKARSIAEGAIPRISSLKDSVHKDSLAGLARYVVSRDK